MQQDLIKSSLRFNINHMHYLHILKLLVIFNYFYTDFNIVQK